MTNSRDLILKLKEVKEERKLSIAAILKMLEDKERASFNRSIEFLKEQVAYKDKRIDILMASSQDKDEMHKQMLEKLLKCSACAILQDKLSKMEQ